MGLSADAYALALRRLFPRGRLWRWIASGLSQLLLGASDELARVRGRADDLVRESDPRTATELLPEHEATFDLAPVGSLDERRGRVVARQVRRQRYRPVDFQNALAPLLGQDAANVVIIERTRALVQALGDDREIFRFFVYRDPALPGAYFVDSAQAVVDEMKPSHTRGHVIESISFACDDPHSLCDRDLLGA